ncbi:MAG: hypothetical protein JWN32_1918 [Solirubrobacterales bacterium]|nr:hypothetical protein [Solirubrobacterales bacterium]
MRARARVRLIVALRFFDRHAVAVLAVEWLLLFVALVVWGQLRKGPVLIAGATATQRVAIFGQLVSSGVAVTAVALTVLAILTALPNAGRAEQLRQGRAWGLLERNVLLAALLAFLTTVLALLCTGIDNVKHGKETLEALLLACAVAGAWALLLGGSAFSLLLADLRRPRPAQPPAGRGAGPA